MIKQWIRKKAKIIIGGVNTYLLKKGMPYDGTHWWDESFYTLGISDRQTISQQMSVISSKYHYASMEMLILKHLHNHNLSIEKSDVLDVGSGSGHWIDFYKSMGANQITGMDISRSSYNYLKNKYQEESNIEVHQGKAVDVIRELNGRHYDIANAIGVMFHIIDDAEWEETIYCISNSLSKNGLFVVGGHFGIMNKINVQIDREGNINKRLRSKRQWANILKKAGFKSINIHQNYSYLWIDDPLPENNVLVATK